MSVTPGHIPPELLHTPISGGGWGCPHMVVLSHLNFMHGYATAFDCRSVHARTVLRARYLALVPSCNDDASVFRRLCHHFGVNFRAVSELPGGCLPEVRPSLLYYAFLFVTTDAGLEQGS